MNPTFDPRQVRRAFSRSAGSYDAAAALQHEVEKRLLESLDYLADKATPLRVLDVGCGPGRAAAAMHKRWPQAQVIALDLAVPMLRQAKKQAGWWKPFHRVCADARALPLAEGSVDVLFSNLCLQWVDDLPAVFAGFRRVLKPGGLLLCSTFGPDTLHELREAFSVADAVPHVSRFTPMAQFGDALLMSGFRDPVLDRDLFSLNYADMTALMKELRAMGATNALSSRRHTLTGRARFAAASQAYEPLRLDNGKLPSSWEVIYAHAWAPPPGAPIRGQGEEIAAVPLSQIPIRRKS